MILLAFLAPALIYLLIWKVGPLFYTIYLSLTSWNPLRRPGPIFIGLTNYEQIINDPRFIWTLVRTIGFTIAACFTELLLGLAFALLLDDQIRGRSIFQTVILLPIVIAPAVVGTIWYILFHDTIGPFTYLAREVGLDIGWLRDSNFAMLSIIITDVWHWTPFMFLILLSGLQVIPRELYESASMDGATYLQSLRYVRLPLLKSTMLVALILRSMDAFRIFDEIMLMTGGGPGESTTTNSILIYKNAFKSFQLGYSSAMVVVLLVISAILYVGYMRYVRLDTDADQNR
jgi:multiple sugar transport system permease protein